MIKNSVLMIAASVALLVVTRATSADKPSQAQADKGKTAEKAVVAVFSLDGPLTESPQAEDFPFGTMNTESLHSLVQRMNKAAEDDDVQAAVVLLGNASIGPGQIEEMHAAMQRLRDAGKDVYAHADSLNMHQYVLLCGASHLGVAPNGDLWINGIYGEGLYLRGLLDLLRVEPDFLTCGDYKSAAETFMNEKASPEAAEMYDWLFDSLFDSYVQLVAKGREVTPKEVRRWINRGLYSAEDAARRGVIDAAQYRYQLVQQLRNRYGDNVTFHKSYAKKKGPQIDFGNPFAAFQIWGEILFGSRERRSTKDAVAVVYVDGPIMPGKRQVSPFGTVDGAYSDPIRKALDKVADDDRVKAVVLRVDSPGGSAVASEIILQATRRVRQKKPLVVSMGNVAGSGGYYVACGAETIFADATTLTGSIGVVGGKLATSRMWKRIGVNFEPIQRGKNADMLSSAHVFTGPQRRRLQAWMDEVYDVFQGHVTAVRGDRLSQPIDQLAGGRVFTGQQALERGLVDRIGSLHDALRFVAEQAELNDYEVRVVPKPKSFLELLMSDLSPDSDEDDERALRLATPASLGDWPILQAAQPLLQQLEPRRLADVQQALVQLEMLRRENVLLAMPALSVRP